MAVRRSIEEKVVVNGERSELLERCRTALQRGGFSKIDVNGVLFQVDASTQQQLAKEFFLT